MLWKIFILLGLYLFLNPISYAIPSNKHIIIAPQCVVQNLKNYQTLATKNQFHLIEISQAQFEHLLIEKEKPRSFCGGFFDVTHAWDQSKYKISHQPALFLNTYLPKPKLKTESYNIHFESEVIRLIKELNPQNLWTNLEILSQYPDRYSRSTNGVKAANWIKSEIENLIKTNNREDASVYLVNTGDYIQPSVVLKIGGSTEAAVVIGAHLDTLSNNKPGADDDGTGTVTVLEVARTLLSSYQRFARPIYFIWYAAEEVGLVGSQYVVADFISKNIPVHAVMQLDMTGYAYQNDRTLWLMDDYVNPDLTAFLEALINTYVKQPVKHSKCGYACSDHATWHLNGFPASIPFESSMSTYNPYIHTSKDTMEKLSLTHMTDYAALAMAFAVELAQPVAR